MGKYKGKNITGLVGPIVQRMGKDGMIIVQTAPRPYKQTKGTRKSGKVFGQGSVLAKEIRIQLGSCYGGHNHDSGLVNRFNTPVRDSLWLCFDKETGIYNFQADSFERLVGFEFNVKSLLINSFFAKPEVVLENNKLKVRIPEFAIATGLKFPRSASVCEFVIIVSQIALIGRSTRNAYSERFTIQSTDTISASREFIYDVLEDCLCTVSLGLRYYSKQDDLRKDYNSEAFSPACIIGSNYNPGVFVDPPARVENGVGYGKDWSIVRKMDFMPPVDAAAEDAEGAGNDKGIPV